MGKFSDKMVGLCEDVRRLWKEVGRIWGEESRIGKNWEGCGKKCSEVEEE